MILRLNPGVMRFILREIMKTIKLLSPAESSKLTYPQDMIIYHITSMQELLDIKEYI